MCATAKINENKKKKWYCKENETRDVAVSAWQRDNEFIQTETVQITAEKEQKI